MSWHAVAELARLDEGPVLLKKSPKQIAVFKSNDNFYAVDNRCPHEGYPLIEGSVDNNCVLTCNWHNWKFQLADGKCVLSGDNVKTYPTKIDDGQVWVDLTSPPPEEIEADILGGLNTAFQRREFDRICREISRLKFNGLDPYVALRKAIEWSHDRFEYGTTHAFAAAGDWVSLAHQFDGDWEKQLICLAETIDHMAFDAIRHPKFSFPSSGEAFQRVSFCAAVEAEDYGRAEGMAVQAVKDGLHWSDLEQAYTEAALAHFNDFGHSAIYVYKTRQLVELVGPEIEQFLVPALARSLCYTTREDLIPEFKHYAPSLQQIPDTDSPTESSVDPTNIFPSSTKSACQWVVEFFPTNSVADLYDRLLNALAQNMLHYDTSYQSSFDRPVNQNVNWLGFSHGLTFANATRVLCDSYPHLWPQGLLQMACFVGRNRSFLDLELDVSEWTVTNRDAFYDSILETVLDHGFRDPIFSAHVLKTPVAVQEELEFAQPETQKNLLASLNRFLNSPIKQKHVRRFARQAIALVQRDFI